MKRLIVTFLVLASGLSFWQGYGATEGSERTSALQAAARLGPAFQVPADDRWANPDVGLSALKDTATALHVNVALSNAGYSARNKPTITQYVFLTGPTQMSHAFRLKSGRWLQAADSASQSFFLASTKTGDSNQIGLLESFGDSTDLAVRPLARAYASLPFSGLYYIETYPGSVGNYDDFTRLFGSKLASYNRLDKPIAAQTFVPVGSSVTTFPSVDDKPLRLLGWGLTIAVGLLVIYRTLSMAKTAGVMRLHGYSAVRVWWLLHGRLIITTMGFLTCAALVAALVLVQSSTPGFLMGTLQSLASTTVLMLAGTALAGIYVGRLRLQESIKNRKDTKGIFVLNSVLNVACTIAFVLFGAGVWAQYNEASRQQSTVKDWSATSKYGIFYPTDVGTDLTADQTGQAGSTAAEALRLYPRLERQGALYIDSTQYEPNANSVLGPGVYQSLVANTNYLSQYPIRLAAGGTVTVRNDTDDWVLLVPDHYRDEQQQILSFFQDQRKSALESEHAIFGDVPAPAIQKQQVRIVWTADHQQVFAFNPSVNPQEGSHVSDPIVQVITNSNSLGIDRANSVTGGANTALKVRLTAEGGDAATLATLQPTLQEFGLSDQLRHLVTMNGYLAAQAESLRQTARVLLMISIVVGVGALGFLVQGIVIALERYGRRAAVRRLFGFSVVVRYREFIWLFCALIGVQIVVAPVLVGAGMSLSGSTNSAKLDSGAALLIAVVFALVEVLTFFGLLSVRGRRRFAQLLKEGF